MDNVFYIVQLLRDFNIISVFVRLLLAAILSGMIGVERSKNGRAAGLRTHILVCLGATIASMTGLYIHEAYGDSGDITRIAAQVISGIGFLGAGTILVKNHSVVTGLTTAACVWATGAIGIAVGYGFYEAAIVGALLIFFITGKLNVVDKKLFRDMKDLSIYVEFVEANKLNETLLDIKNLGLDIDTMRLSSVHTNLPNGIGAELNIQIHKNEKAETVLAKLNKMDNVHFAVTMLIH